MQRELYCSTVPRTVRNGLFLKETFKYKLIIVEIPTSNSCGGSYQYVPGAPSAGF
jgi:hypothetical protein